MTANPNANRRCLLITIDGEFDAIAHEPSKDWAGRDVVRIEALNGKYAINVTKALADSKFERERFSGYLPEFFAC